MKGKLNLYGLSLIFFATLLLAFTSCADKAQDEFVLELDLFGAQVEVPPATKSFPNVNQKLWPYFESFERAGKERGLNFNLAEENISGDIDFIEEGEYWGSCTTSADGSMSIIIDNEFWNASNDGYKELIIFHELAHCYLGKEHNDEQFSNGVCKSIMRSSNAHCLDNYTVNTRSYYLNELFGL